MMLNNCLIFAVLESIKQRKYVVIRKSRREYKWPFCHYHFLIIPKKIADEYIINFIPVFDVLDTIKKGEYVVIVPRKKRIGHFFTIPKSIVDEYAIGFVPVASTLGDYPPPLFRGFIQTGDLTEMEIEERDKDRRKYTMPGFVPEKRVGDRRKKDVFNSY